MISFRFHVVSITAIFLALAVGVVVGSTYVDDAVSGPLRNRIDTVEHNADATREENDRLEGELGSAREFIEASADYAVTDRLIDVPLAVVALRGIDEGAVERTVVLARQAGAMVPGIIWLEPRWDLEGEGDVEALSELVAGSPGESVDDLHARAWDAIASELDDDAAEDDPLDPTTGGTAADTLLALEEAGFVSTDAVGDDSSSIDDLGGAGARLLLVSGSRADGRLAELVPTIVDSSLDAGLVTVVADVHVDSEEGPQRAETLGALLEQQELAERIVLVDDADREEGRVAAVLGLHAAANGEVGVHYGYGDGADGVLPAWTEP